nr:RecName: Full=Protein Hook homolog 3 [Bos taurus]
VELQNRLSDESQ